MDNCVPPLSNDPADEAAAPDPLSLTAFTEAERRSPNIAWYRCPLPPGEMKKLQQRSDLLGAAQTLGYLAILLITGGLTVYASRHWAWWATVGLLFCHGTVAAFLINAVHELGHGTVFRTRWLNEGFVHLFAFIGWINHEFFATSHARHHRYTLHPPDDLEVKLPFKAFVSGILRWGVIDPRPLRWKSIEVWRIARGRFRGEWELALYPPDDPARSRATVRWARCLLMGHLAITVTALATGWWMVPVVVSLTPLYGSWLFALCNTTQHIGLQDNVADFRLCCRTFTLNPVVRFLYWQMNYHIEHHMFAAVPCYRLKRLHALIRHDLPPCPDGLAAVWREIEGILARQEADPGYQFSPPLPGRPAPTAVAA